MSAHCPIHKPLISTCLWSSKLNNKYLDGYLIAEGVIPVPCGDKALLSNAKRAKVVNTPLLAAGLFIADMLTIVIIRVLSNLVKRLLVELFVILCPLFDNLCRALVNQFSKIQIKLVIYKASSFLLEGLRLVVCKVVSIDLT